jgi:hypothetical protein
MDELNFETFLHNRLRERGMNLKRLSEVSGITLKYLEYLSRGEFSQLPPAPYVRGYLLRLGTILDFDGNAWWERLQEETSVKRAGGGDMLPRNRFAIRSPRNIVIGAVIILIIAAYAAFRLSKLFGVPDLTVNLPSDGVQTVVVEALVISGHVENADEVSINDERVPVGEGGAWQKQVMLQPGLNTFSVKASKTLGRQRSEVRQVLYQPPQATSTPQATIF